MNNKRYNVLVACEESQVTTIAFRKRGFNAFSCDLQEMSGGHPEYHIKGDAARLLDTPVIFKTMDKKIHRIAQWHLLIAHPPCTYITKCSAVRMFVNHTIQKERYEKMLEACEFFKKFLNCSIPLICVENPIPLRIAPIPRPTTYIEPYWFGEPFSKRTCLWLKNLPPLMPTIISSIHEPWVNGGTNYNKHRTGRCNSAKQRSKTFPEVAKQFAEQYGNFMIEYYKDK